MADNNRPSLFAHIDRNAPVIAQSAWAPLGGSTVVHNWSVPNRSDSQRGPPSPTASEAAAPVSAWDSATSQEVNDNNMREEKPAKANVNVLAVDFSPADKKLLEFGMHSDAKVIANGKVYNVHKSVLCTRSKWFRAALESGFMEGNSSVVNISAADNIDQLLEFLYTGAVDLSMYDETQVMAAANELAVLGDFYQVDELKNYAEQVLGQYLGTHLTSICAPNGSAPLPHPYLTLQDWNSCPENYRILKEAGFVDRLCAAIREAYATPSGIHRVYVAFVCAARKCTFKCQLIREFKKEVPEFADDLLNAMMDGLDCAAFEGNVTFEKWKDTLSAAPRERFCAGCSEFGRHRHYSHYQDI